MNDKKYTILNYGCQMNESDSEHFAGQLSDLGYTLTNDYHAADVVVVNTCCVRESAELKILGKIGELKTVKANRPGLIICVAGCMAQKGGDKLVKKYPQIDLLIGTAQVNNFKAILLDFLADKGQKIYDDVSTKETEFEGQCIRKSSFAAWIPIMYGCNNFCAYCIVPYVRGRERRGRPEPCAASSAPPSRSRSARPWRYSAARTWKSATALPRNAGASGCCWPVTPIRPPTMPSVPPAWRRWTR